MGFTQTKSDACIYVSTGEEIFIIAVYIDYILLATRTDKRMTEVKKKIASKFKVKDLGKLRYFLGVKVIPNKK